MGIIIDVFMMRLMSSWRDLVLVIRLRTYFRFLSSLLEWEIWVWADDLAGDRSHGWSHVDFTSLTIEQIHRQINLTEIALEKILGIKPKYFRPRQSASSLYQSFLTELTSRWFDSFRSVQRSSTPNSR